MCATPPRKERDDMNWRHQTLIFCGVVALLLGVFWLYSRPNFMVTIVNQIWTCF